MAYEEVVRRFGGSGTPVLLEAQAVAMTYKGMTLGELNRVEEGMEVLEEVVRRFGEDESPSLPVQVEGAASRGNRSVPWQIGAGGGMVAGWY